MRSLLTLLISVFAAFALQGANAPVNWTTAVADNGTLSAFASEADGFTADNFLDLTPKKFREMTGERLGIKGSLALKAAQKHVKKQMKAGHSTSMASDIPKGLYVVGAIFGFAWILMGLMDDFEGNNWWLNLILTFLCFIPGVVHALIKMKDYY